MPHTLKNALLSARDLFATAGPFVLLALLLLVGAYWLLDPTPPRHIVLATGPENGAYAEFGTRYAQRLRSLGIEVTLRGTEGSAENLRLLRDAGSGVDFAFVQGGTEERRRVDIEAAGDDQALVSLGSLFYEPVWLFYRQASAQDRLGRPALERLVELEGWRINIGTRGSGVTALMRQLLDANGMTREQLHIERLAGTPAVVALLAGELDALVFTSAPEAPLVQMLLQTPGVSLLHFNQAQAYSRRFPYLSPVVLPRGVVDLAADMPPQDVDLIAPTAMLVGRTDAHPALVQLLVQTAQAIHAEAGWFQRKGEFPSDEHLQFPVAAEAARYYRSGPPLLQRYLPFWLANLIDRMWVALVSIVAVLIPLSRIVPPLYEFRIRSRVFRWYARLREIEDSLPDGHASRLLVDLEDLERRVTRLSIPLSHADELYALRAHIHLVRRKLLHAMDPSLVTDAPAR